MSPTPLFAFQFIWFLIAWTTLATLFVVPKARTFAKNDALSVWIIPHLFRVLGVGLLVPNLSPGMPFQFALSTAIGDSITAVFALLSLIALQKGWAHARKLVWTFSIVGLGDLLIALPQAAYLKTALYLKGQWYVPALAVPLMLVCHIMVIRTLIAHPEPPQG